MKKVVASLTLAFATVFSSSHAITLIGWDIPTSTTIPAVTGTTVISGMAVATGVTAGNFTMGTGLTSAPSSSTWRATSYNQYNTTSGLTESAALVNANNNGDYWAFQLSAASGYRVVVNGIGSGTWSISTAGPQRMSLIYSTTSNFATYTTIATATAASGGDVNFASSFTTALAAAPITIQEGTTGYFRLVGYWGTSTGGSGGLIGNLAAPDFSILGTVTSLNAPYTWTGGSGAWAQGVTANWESEGSSVAWQNGKDPSFSSGGTLAVDSGGVSGGIMSLSGTTPVTLTGGALALLSMNADVGSELNLNGNTATVSGSINMTDASLKGGNLSLGGTLLANISTGTKSLSTALQGGGSLSKTGAGQLILSATNTLSGGTTVGVGTLSTSGNEVLSDSATLLVSSNATFKLGGNETVGALSAAFGSFIDLQGNTLTAGGNNMSYTNGAAITGTGGLVKNGTGQMYMNNSSNTYSGGFVMNGGSVAFTSSGTTTAGVLVSSVFGTGNLTLNDGTTITSSSATSGRNVNNNIFMSGNVQFGNSAWGTTNVQMNPSTTTSTNTNTGVVTTNTNYTPLFTASTNASSTTTLRGDTTINTINWVDWYQPINGNFRITKSGTGALSALNNYLLLRASNNIAGVTVASGVLSYKNRNALGSGTAILSNGVALAQDGVINNLPLTGNDQTDRAIPNNIRLDGDVTFGSLGQAAHLGGNIDLNGGITRVITLGNTTYLYGGVINGGQLVIDNGATTGSRTFAIFGVGNYTGGTVVRTNAALAVGNNQALGSGDLIFTNTSGSGTAILRASTISTDSTQVRTISNNIQLATGSVVTLDAVTSAQDSIGTNITVALNMVLSGNISGGGGLTKSNNNTVTLSGNNTSTGPNTVVNGTLRVENPSFTANITSNAISVNFPTPPPAGPYTILPNLAGTYPTPAVTGLATGQTVSWDNATDVLTVNAAITPPSGLSYTPSTITGTVGTAISSLSPSVTGTPTSYSVSPELPAGLSLNTSTGVISGTPSVVASSATYTVTASNSGGSTPTTLTIVVNSAGPTFADSYKNKNMSDIAPNGLSYLMNYAFGGSDNTEPRLPVQDTSDPAKLTLVAYVRTGDSTLSVVGEVASELPSFDSANTIAGDVVSPSDAPAGMEKRNYSVSVSGDKKFLRLKAIKQ